MAYQIISADDGKSLVANYLDKVRRQSDAELHFRIEPVTSDRMLHEHRFWEMIFYPGSSDDPFALPTRVVVTPPRVKHEEIERNGCVVCFQLDSGELNCSYCRRGFGNKFDAENCGTAGRLLRLFEVMCGYEGIGDETFRRLRRDTILAAMIEFFERLPDNLQSQPHYVNNAQWYIASRFHDPDLRVADVAAHAALSSHQLNRIMRSETGMTIGRAISEYRLNRAKELLATTGFSTTVIAAMCGFRERSYFSAFFRRRFGVSPSAWRELGAAGHPTTAPETAD